MSEERSTRVLRVELQGAVRVARGRLFDIQSVIEDAKKERAALDGFVGTLRGLFGGKEAAIARADVVLAAAEATKVKIAAQVSALEEELAEFDAQAKAEAAATEALESARSASVASIMAAGGANAEALELLEAQIEVMRSVVLSAAAMESSRAASRMAADVADHIRMSRDYLPGLGGKGAARRAQHARVEFAKFLASYRETLSRLTTELGSTEHSNALASLATLEIPESHIYIEETIQIGGPWELKPVHHRFVEEAAQLAALGEVLEVERRNQADQLAAVTAERDEFLDGVAGT